MERSAGPAPAESNLAIALAVAAVVLLLIFAVAGIESALWLIVGALGLGAAIAGFLGGRPRGLTLGASVAGAVIAVVVIVWGIVG